MCGIVVGWIGEGLIGWGICLGILESAGFSFFIIKVFSCLWWVFAAIIYETRSYSLH